MFPPMLTVKSTVQSHERIRADGHRPGVLGLRRLNFKQWAQTSSMPSTSRESLYKLPCH
jgi:hypothetical protein